MSNLTSKLGERKWILRKKTYSSKIRENFAEFQVECNNGCQSLLNDENNISNMNRKLVTRVIEAAETREESKIEITKGDNYEI